MKEFLSLIKKWMTRLLAGIATVLLSIMTLLVLYQVFTRYILNSPAAFTEELVRYFLIWTSFIGAFFYFLSKLCHCNMDCMGFAKAVGKCKHHRVFRCSFCTGFYSALSAACKTEQGQSYSGCNCCQFFHRILSPFYVALLHADQVKLFKGNYNLMILFRIQVFYLYGF